MRTPLPCLILIVCCLLGPASRAGEPMLELEFNGRFLQGKPLSWERQRIELLGRDGRLWEIPFSKAKNYRQAAQDFSSFSAPQMRAELAREFGSRYEVASTGHYLVVYPRGEGRFWSQRFEQLYRNMSHYFSVRGFQIHPPRFPLVAIVFSSREEFFRYAAAEKERLGSRVVGYYSPTSNRVALYNRGNGQDWQMNAQTIIHEATHQTAFNVGIHSRYCDQPQWVIEGLGTLFEADGVWNSRQFPRATDRINRGQLKNYRDRVARWRRGWLAEYISSNRAFQGDATTAYCRAWALTYYLVETQPTKYFRYLTLTASRPDGSAYNAPQRLRDFTSVFGGNLGLMEAQFQRYMQRLN